MKIDVIIQQVLDNPYSAFFYTPSYYSKSSSYLFSNSKEIIPIYNKNDLHNSLPLVDSYLEKGLRGYCLIEYEAGYLMEEKLEKLLAAKEQKLMQFFFFEEKNITKIKSVFIEFGEIEPKSFSVSDFKLKTTQSKFFNDIKKIKQYIEEGDTYQVNYAVKSEFNFTGSYASLFKNLLFNQSANYSAFINNENNYIISLSPELFIQIDKKRIKTKPMKGTLNRTKNIKSDSLKEYELRNSKKNMAENVMIVDLLRNDLGKFCKYGSVKVDELYGIETYESLFQMVSTVRGRLVNGTSLGEMIKYIFPCGSITGAPKIRTMDIIHELEADRRGIYTGAIGMIGKEESVLNVAIRTIKIEKETGVGEMGLGSGIVWDSEPEKEYSETLLKGDFITAPLKQFELIETMLLDDGQIFLFEDHLERLRSAAKFFLFNINEDKITKSLFKKIDKKYSKGKYKIRLTLNKWGKVKYTFNFITLVPDVVKIIISDKTVDSENKFQYFKTTNRELYTSELSKYNRAGYFEVIFFNEKDELAEGCTTNIFIKKNDVWLTPPISSGILPGIYRNHFMYSKKDVKETIITINDLLHADEVMLVNSVIGEVKVASLYYENEFVEYKQH
jgi:para-aminobenzoate synthetase/4-amino-4-deoxychorismate lyase